MRVLKIGVICFTIASMLGCAGIGALNSDIDYFKGKPVDSVIAIWGQPYSLQQTTTGYEYVWEFVQPANVTMLTTNRSSTTINGLSSTKNSLSIPAAHDPYQCDVKLELNQEHVVTDGSYKGVQYACQMFVFEVPK